MSTENKKTRRNYSMIFRFIQLIIALASVFFLSFFITIAIKTPHPIEYIRTAYFTDTSKDKDKVIDEYANNNMKKSVAKNSTDSSKTTGKEVNSDEDFTSTNSTRTGTSTDSEVKVEVKNKDRIDASTFMGKIKRLRSIKQAVNEKMLDKEHYVVLDDIPLSLRRAIIAVEDTNFYKHSGFDLGGIARATIVNVEAGHIEEGGSTITQQLVKNLFLSQEQSFTRKAEELLLAMDMERNFTKDEILELYLNTIYFGSSFYGIYDASKGYFGVEPKDLSIAESAMLAGLPNAPSVYSPYVDFMLAKKRQLIVIDAMVKANILTKSEAERAKIDTIILAKE